MDTARLFWIAADALELLKNAERTQRRFIASDTTQFIPCWEPPVDLYEHEEELRLLVALPGVDLQQLEVRLEGNVVLVRGDRPMHAVSRHGVIHRLEIPYGRFERRIELPPGRFGLHEQRLKDGWLILVLRQP